MKKTKDLYTTKDVAEVREKLYKLQNKIDPITKEVIPDNQKVLDHCHKTQYVRAVLHRQTNSVLGKIENLWTRYLGWWYTGTLQEFLRNTADYLDLKIPKDYVHPKWIKKVQTEFNKLTSKQKDKVLAEFTDETGTNDTQRKLIFKSLLTPKKDIGFLRITKAIEKSKL